MAKIESLTPEQEAQIPIHRQEYFDVGWSTDPADRPRAEAAIRGFYKFAERDEPKFLWFDSPKACVDFIEEQTKEKVAMSYFDGHINAFWIAYYTFCEEIGVEYDPKDADLLKLWDEYARSAGSMYPYEFYALMCERPCVAKYDENERLSCEDGPALAYRDGFSIYAIGGVTVPEKVVMEPWNLTLEEIKGQENIEVQRIMQDRWCYEELDEDGIHHKGDGNGRWLTEIGAETLDTDVFSAYESIDPDTGEEKFVQIMRCLLKTPEGLKYMMCTDSSTARVYYLRANDDDETCIEAHKSISGFDDSDIMVSS